MLKHNNLNSNQIVLSIVNNKIKKCQEIKHCRSNQKLKIIITHDSQLSSQTIFRIETTCENVKTLNNTASVKKCQNYFYAVFPDFRLIGKSGRGKQN